MELEKEAELEKTRLEMELKRKETIEILQQQKDSRKLEKPGKARKRTKLDASEMPEDEDETVEDLSSHRNLDNQMNMDDIEKDKEQEEARRLELLARLREMKMKK